MKEFLVGELNRLRVVKVEHEKVLNDPDYQDDYTEGHSWLGYLEGQVDLIEKLLTMI